MIIRKTPSSALGCTSILVEGHNSLVALCCLSYVQWRLGTERKDMYGIGLHTVFEMLSSSTNAFWYAVTFSLAL